MKRICFTAALAALAVLVVGSTAFADGVADFYHGRDLRFIVGYGAGGGATVTETSLRAGSVTTISAAADSNVASAPWIAL